MAQRTLAWRRSFFQRDSYQAENHEWQPINDLAPAPSLEWLRKQVAFIAAQRAANRRLFVHCDAGISRSGMVTAAYFMFRDHLTRDQALGVLHERRPVIHPHAAFLTLLEQYENVLHVALQSHP